MQHIRTASVFDTYGTPEPCVGGQEPRFFRRSTIALISLGATVALCGFGISSKASAAATQHVVWTTSVQATNAMTRISVPTGQRFDLKSIPSSGYAPQPSAPKPERVPESISMAGSTRPPTIAPLEHPSPVASPAMWVWIGRVLSSLIFLLGFRMCDKIEGKSAIAMVATTGETTEGADGTKKSKRAIIRSFFARPKKETLQPADPEDAQKAVALAEAEEDNQMETSSKSAAADEPFRLKMWQAAAGGLLAVVLVNSTLNSVVYSYLDTYSDALGLVERGGTEVAEKLMQAKEQLHYDMVMGHIPTMTQTELSEKLQEIGHELEEEHKVEQLHATANTISDAVVAFLVVATLINYKSAVSKYFKGVSNGFLTLSNTSQAFTLLLVSDMLVGYHSADGWDAVLKALGSHYGAEAESLESPISIFVATVPVGLDVAFRFWVFRELRKWNASTQVILDEIDG
uniref:Chloroplast envelope membrane protein n=2 Tax=Eutreptiella gymnastica TaxID=73025 RepID=A0A7S4GEA7_9EUGL